MLIIPVLDIKDGLVVRARMGDRDAYHPIDTPLAATAEIGDVAEGLRAVHPFSTFYIADLDAIAGDGGKTRRAGVLSALAPAPAQWLDAGFSSFADVERVLDIPGIYPVVGSESQENGALLMRYRADSRVILSLDFRAEAFIGPPDILEDSDLWPNRVIVMTLGRVGGVTGPDFKQLAAITKVAGGREIIAAGGIRHVADLERLRDMGIAAALVATSLHNGSLTGAAIAELARQRHR